MFYLFQFSRFLFVKIILLQTSSTVESNAIKIPDRPFKIFSKENKGLHGDDDVILDSPSVKSTNNFLRPSVPVRNLAPSSRSPGTRMNRPVLPPSPQMPRGRIPLRNVSPRLPMRAPLPQVRTRMSHSPGGMNAFQRSNRGRPRGPNIPFQRGPNPLAGRMPYNPRIQHNPRMMSNPRTPIFNTPRGPALRQPLPRQQRPLRPPAPIQRKLSNQIQITPRATVPKVQNSSPSQAFLNVKEEPRDDEDEYEDEDDYQNEIPANVVTKPIVPAQKLPQLNITPTQPRGSSRISSSVQITPKVSSQVQITPRPAPLTTQARTHATMNKQVEDTSSSSTCVFNTRLSKEELFAEDPEEEQYSEYEEETGDENYSEYEGEYGEQEAPVLPATPVSSANIRIIKEEPKDEERDVDIQDDYYEEDNYDEYHEESHETNQPSQLIESKPLGQSSTPRVSSSVQITPKISPHVQVAPQKKPPLPVVQANPVSIPKVTSSVQITLGKQLQGSESESEEYCDESYQEEAEEEEEEYYDEEMDEVYNPNHPVTAANSTPNVSNKLQNVSITSNANVIESPAIPKKMPPGISITPNKPLPNSFPASKIQGISNASTLPKGVSHVPNKLQNVSITPNKSQHISATPNLPKGISITPKNTTPVLAVPGNVALSSNIPSGVSMTPRVNAEVSNIQSQPKTEEYYEEEMGEEEEELEDSFEDYGDEHDGNEVNQQNSLPPSSNVYNSQKSEQYKVETILPNLPQPQISAPATAKPTMVKEVKTPFTTPTKPISSDVKKHLERSPSVDKSRPAPASHNRPRSLIEAISMISSGKMNVENVSTPSPSKKTPKKDDYDSKKADENNTSSMENEGTSKVENAEFTNSDNLTKQTNEDIKLRTDLPTVKNNNIFSQDVESDSTEESSAQHETQKNKDLKKEPSKMKMRPKSKLLQFRKQTKNPPSQNTVEADTSNLDNLETESTSAISTVNVSKNVTTNEESDVEGDLGNFHEHNTTQPAILEKISNPEMETSTRGASMIESDTFEENQENYIEFSNNQVQKSNSVIEEQEIAQQLNTNREGTQNNDRDYEAPLADETIVDSNTNETNIDTKENYMVETISENEDHDMSVGEEESDRMDTNETSNANKDIQPDEDVNEQRNDEAMETEEEEYKSELVEGTTEESMQGQREEFDKSNDEEQNNEDEELAEDQEDDENLEEEEEENDDEEENYEEEETDEEEEETEIDEEEPDKDEEEPDAGENERESLETPKKKKKEKKKKRKKAKASKPKKRSNKRKSSDNLDETPAAKKNKTENGESTKFVIQIKGNSVQILFCTNAQLYLPQKTFPPKIQLRAPISIIQR